MVLPVECGRVICAGTTCIVALLVCASQLAAQSPTDIRAWFGKPQVIAHDVEFDQPAAAAAFTDGAIAIVDFKSHTLYKLSRSGAPVWKYGRKGSGPGEFSLPLRVLSQPDGSMLVLDIGNQRVTHVTKDGQHIGDYKPDVAVTAQHAITTSAGEVLLSGTSADPRAIRKPLHLFTANMKHVRSFGEPPDVADLNAERGAGTGGISRGVDGAIIHTRAFPFSFMRYDVRGQLRSTARVAVPVDHPSTYQIRNGGSVRTNPDAIRGNTVHQLTADRFLAGTHGRGLSKMHLLNARGEVLSTMLTPAEWGSILLVDTERRVIWTYATRDDVPVLLQIPILH